MSDLIKRQDAIRAIRHTIAHYYPHLKGFNETLPLECEYALCDVPSADRPQGEWMEQEDDYYHYWECSECGMGVGLDDIRNYCPNCGCRMKGVDDEEPM